MTHSILNSRSSIAARKHLFALSPYHLVFALLLFFALPAHAQTTSAPATKSSAPTTAVDQKNCVTAECHAEVKAYKVVHGPVNVDACDACHKLTDAAKHKYELTRPKNQVCTFCHKIETAGATVVHQPVKTGDCLPCHNPHGGKTTKFIRGDKMRENCNGCHKDVVGNKKFVHGPVAADACEACHSPHMSKNPKLLVEQGKTLCLSCHKEMGDQVKRAKVVHKPVVEGECSVCHDPHASDFKMQVKAEPFALCTGCHEHDKIKQVATDAKYKHGAVKVDQACLNCHTPHGGPLAKLMKAPPVDLCMKCHNAQQKTSDGRMVKAMPELVDPKLNKHGPVRDGTCGGCHDPHGSELVRLLAKPYPETFYAKFDPDNFALCFSCHDRKLVETPEAEGLTGFRNGTQNLHYVHVDKEKGRTCRACHEVHAGPGAAHTRATVPFGQWELPISFKKTDSGGSCAPGCHKEYGYDRKAPVNNGTGAPPAGTQSAATARAPASTTAPATTTPAPGATVPKAVSEILSPPK